MITVIVGVLSFIGGFGFAVFMILWSADNRDGNMDYKRRR